MSLFDKAMLPLKGKDAPKGVVTASGTMSYEDFAKKELAEYHQHGTVSDLMGVLGIGGKPSRDWSEGAAETFAVDLEDLERASISQSWDTPLGVMRENFGNLVQHEPMTEERMLQSVTSYARAHRMGEIDASIFKVNHLIHSQTLSGILPASFR